MALVLLQVLERTELNKLPKAAQNKLEKYITDLQSENYSLKRQHERFKADCEQQYFEVEKRLSESLEQAVSYTRDIQTLKDDNRRLNEELSTLKGIEEEELSDEKPQQQTKAKYEIEAERRELARLLEKRTQEVENLTEDMQRLNERLVETNTAKVELQLKLDDIQSSEVSMQHREKRVKQEKELLVKQTEWLNTELKTKTEELLQLAKNKGQEVLELRCGLEASKEQVSRLESQVSSLKESSECYQSRVEDLLTKLKQVSHPLTIKQSQDQQTVMEEKYRNELNAHIKLSNLYKGAASDSETKNQELNRAVQELAQLVKENAEANKSLEKKVDEAEGSKVRVEAELQEKLKKMEKELDNAQLKASQKQRNLPSLTEEELDSMCPTAAAVAKIVRPGMRFMELYNAFVEAQDQLQQEKQETRRVSRVLDEIVQEVESKAPVLKRQRQEYESMGRSMTSLCSKLEQARTEIHSLQKQKEDANQGCDVLDRDKRRLEGQLEDTSTQVRALLVELETARGNQVTREDGSSAAITSTSEVISPRRSASADAITPPHLTFRSVEELQRQNQSLLGRVRELEEERERQAEQATSTRVSELQQSAEQTLRELAMVKKERDQQQRLADSHARQRDMYRILLSQSTDLTLPPQGAPVDSAPPRPSAPPTRSTPLRSAAAENTPMAQSKAALKQLSEAFMLYKKEKAENDRMLTETNELLQKQLSELRSTKAKLSSQLEFTNKRYEMLQDNLSAYRREIAALQERNQKMSATAQSHERIIHTMTQDLQQAQGSLAVEEVRAENLRKERDMWRETESRLNQEREAMMAQQRSQNLLLSNLKTIQLTMDHSDTETRQRLNGQIERLERELIGLKGRLEQEVEQRHALGRSMDAQLLEAKKQLETQNALHQKTKELLRIAEKQVASDSVTPAVTSTPAQVTRGGIRAPPRAPAQQALSQEEAERELTEVKGRLRQSEELADELRERLKTSNANVEQYRSVVVSLEDNLNKEKQARSPLEVRLKEAQEVILRLERRILEAEREKEAQQEERRRAVEAVEKQVCELKRSIKAMQTEHQEALERATAAVTQEQKATQDSILQTRLASEAQAKYERELMLHAADVEALQASKRQAQQGALERRVLEERAHNTSTLLQEKTTSWSQLEKQMKEDLSNEKRCLAELGKQNSLLHQQMEELGRNKVPAQQQRGSGATASSSNSDEGKSSQQILEILRFVRREKEIAETRCEVSERQMLTYKQKLEHQNKDLGELQETLTKEREKSQATIRNMALQDEKLKKMENINVLMETNKMLKQERERLEQELQQAQAKMSKLQSDITPLQSSMSGLTEKNSTLQAEKRILEEDLKRWKARTQQLMSQQKDSDVEENKKLTNEREAQLRRIQQLTEETGRLKTELARSAAAASTAQSQLQSLRDSVSKLTAEQDALKKNIETKTSDLLERNRTITQVKKIGRRYKTQYEELKAQHDKLVEENAARPELAQNQESQQEVQKLKEELQASSEEAQKSKEEVERSKEETKKSKEEVERSKEETKKARHEVQEARQENQKTKEQLKEVQNQLTQVQNQLSQVQNQLQQAKTQSQQFQTQLRAAQNQVQSLRTQNQQNQKELQAARDQLTQNQTNQSSQDQEVSALKTSLSQLESKVSELEAQSGSLEKTLSERDAEVVHLQEQLAQANQTSDANRATEGNDASRASQTNQASEEVQRLQEEVYKLKEELQERSSQQDALKQQMADKEEKTKKAFMGAKQKINQLNSAREQQSKEIEELKQSREEQEVRLSALRSQYEGRIQRLDRELSDLQGAQTRPVTHLDRELGDLQEGQTHPVSHPEQREEGEQSSTPPAPPQQQRRLTVKSQAADRGSSSSTDPPTANIRPTPSKPCPSPGNKATPRASIRPMVTPAAVSMPTPTATVMPTTQADSMDVFVSTSGSVRCTSPSVLTSLPQPTSSQATAFVQPTQQQAANQEPGSMMDAERPSTSSSLIGCGGLSGLKRGREEEPGELPEESYPVLAEEEEEDDEGGVSQSVPSTQSPTQERDVIVIDTDSESREEEEEEEEEEDEEEESRRPSSSSSLTPRLPQSPRRPPHPLPPRLYIQAPSAELGPPHTQRQSSQLRRPSVGRGPQLTPGVGSMQHFFDDDDRMVPSTPTLVVPHRTDGFAEAIHSPQVAGVPQFRFGPPEDMIPQTSSSHSDLGQLASQGGLGMYESPLFLAAHDEESGGRSVPTTPLQVAAPVTVFTESLPSDTSDMASQSVPMVTTSTGLSVAGDDGDEVFMEAESEGPSGEVSLQSQAEMDSAGQPDSQEPDTSSSVRLQRPLQVPQQHSSNVPPRGRGGRTLVRRGVGFPRGGSRGGGAFGRGGLR
ncbi:nucleoprotein TPR [Aplochiton taeniatus]